MNTTKHTVITKRSRNGHEAKAELTLDWNGMTPEAIRELAVRTVIIKWQQGRKSCKSDAELDAQYSGKKTLKVSGIEWGPRRGPRDPKAEASNVLGNLTDKDLVEVLKARAKQLPPEMRKGLFED